MRALSVAAFLALLLAAPAAAGAPAGFREAPALEPAASWAAGKPVKVFCTGEYGEGGHAWPGSSEIYLAPEICSYLRGQLDPSDAGELLILVHEAVHASGIADEGQTECRALHTLPSVAARFFGFDTWRSRHNLMERAWESYRALPAAYRTVCS